MLAICSAQPNWMPRKPTVMFQICPKLSRGFSTPIAAPLCGLPDKQDEPLVRTECERQLAPGAPGAKRLVGEEIAARAGRRSRLDCDGLPHGRATEIDRRDLGPLAGGQPMDHEEQSAGLHRRGVDPLALVSAD